MATIKVDDKEYNIEDLNDVAKTQIMNLQHVERKINELRSEIAMLNAAKEYYTLVLKSNLPKDETESAVSDDTVKFS
jgi:hypothetical protein